jgi:two-component system cell cycle response regulator
MSTILVVDDTALAREAVAKLLEYEGFKVMRAVHGRDAWAMMYDNAPDLVLLDLMMPEMDGVTLLRMIRRSNRWENLPVVVLTGATDDQKLIQRARELKIQDLVPKASFGFDDLLRRLKAHLPDEKGARPAHA